MRLFSKKSFTFKSGELEATIKNHEIKDMPDWIEKTLLFDLAKKDGSISIIENREQLNAIEKGEKNKEEDEISKEDKQENALDESIKEKGKGKK